MLSIEDALKKTLGRDSAYDLRIEGSQSYPEPPPLPGELVQGVLRFGHKMVLAGPPDSGKTSLMIYLGLAVSQGKPWIGLATQPAHVLYVNLELDSTSFVHRVHQVAKAVGFSPCDKRFHFINHRGGNLDPSKFALELRKQLVEAKLAGIDFKLVIVDPIYKLVGMGGADESSNLRASRLISGLGMIAEIGDIAIASTIDVPNSHPRYQVSHEVENGNGQLARDADSLLTLWPLERHETGFRLKGQMREFEAFKPMSLSFTYPFFIQAPELDRVPIVGSIDTLETAEEINAEISVWKVWDTLNTTVAVSLEDLAKAMGVTSFEARQKVLQAGPNPNNPSKKLRLAAGNKVKEEE